MKRDEALDLLRHHAKQHLLVSHPESQSGFLGMLVPYEGCIGSSSTTELPALHISRIAEREALKKQGGLGRSP